jgi:hypothetical protein
MNDPKGFLNMQERRRKEPSAAYAPDGSHLNVAAEYWERLSSRDPQQLAAVTQFQLTPENRLIFRFLSRDVLVDANARCLRRLNAGDWEKADDPLLELATVLYLINVKDVYPLGRDIVGPRDLKEGHFFQGPHELKIAPLVERYGADLQGFRKSAESLGGEPVEMADAAYRLKPFPRVNLYYLLWEGDEEFKPRMSVLFERSIEETLAADAIWGLVNRVSTALLTSPETPPG